MGHAIAIGGGNWGLLETGGPRNSILDHESSLPAHPGHECSSDAPCAQSAATSPPPRRRPQASRFQIDCVRWPCRPAAGFAGFWTASSAKPSLPALSSAGAFPPIGRAPFLALHIPSSPTPNSLQVVGNPAMNWTLAFLPHSSGREPCPASEGALTATGW